MLAWGFAGCHVDNIGAGPRSPKTSPTSTVGPSPTSGAASTLPTLMGKKAADGKVWGIVGDSIALGVGTTNPFTKSFPRVAGIPGSANPGQCLVATTCGSKPLVVTFPTQLKYLRQSRGGVNAVVVEMGLNDLVRGITNQAYVNAFHKLQTEAAGQHVLVVFSTITPRSAAQPYTSKQEAQRRWVNGWIRHQGPFVYFSTVLGGHAMLPRYSNPGGQHPNDAGAAAMGHALTDWIAKN